MPNQVTDRREDPRSEVPDFQNAVIEFTGPDGTAHKRPLIELSVNGGSFQLPEPIPGLEVGATVAGSVIRFGEFEIHVNFIIRRVTSYEEKRVECGVQLFTMNDQDRNEMAALISRLEQYLKMI